MIYSFVLALLITIPTISRAASVQYYGLLVFIFAVFAFTVFGLLVYWHYRFLLRVLTVISSALVLLTFISFVASYAKVLECRHKEHQLMSANTTDVKCNTHLSDRY